MMYKIQCLNRIRYGPIKDAMRSDTARLATRYVAEFLKHFSGSLMNTIKSSTWRTTPNAPIMREGIYCGWKFEKDIRAFESMRASACKSQWLLISDGVIFTRRFKSPHFGCMGWLIHTRAIKINDLSNVSCVFL
jgi:hypothetical protein